MIMYVTYIYGYNNLLYKHFKIKMYMSCYDIVYDLIITPFLSMYYIGT